MGELSVQEFRTSLETAPSIKEKNFHTYFKVYSSSTPYFDLFNIFGREKIAEWLDQFSEKDQKFAIDVFSRIKYFDEDLVRTLCQLSYFELVSLIKSLGKDTIFIGVGGSGKSGQMIAYLFRTANSIPEANFKFIDEIDEEDIEKSHHVVFLDDIVGSGKQFLDYWRDTVKPLFERVLDKRKFFLISLISTHEGKRNILKSLPNIKLIIPFTIQHQYYDSDQYEILKKYGQGLWKKGHELGWENNGETVMFFYNVPNNTLPILWSTKFSRVTSSKWKPLQARAITTSIRNSNKNILNVLKQYIYKDSFSSDEYMIIIKIMLDSYAVLEPGDLTGEDMYKFAQTASDFFAPYEGALSHGAIFECLPNLRKGIATIFFEYVRLQPTKEIFTEFLHLFLLDEYTRHPDDLLQTHLVELAYRLLIEFPDLEVVLVEQLGIDDPKDCLRTHGSFLTLRRKKELTPNSISKLQDYKKNGVDQCKYLSEGLFSIINDEEPDFSGINLAKVYLLTNFYGEIKVWSIETINKYS